MEGSDTLQSWLQLATSGGFTVLAWYLIVVALPKMQERFDQHADRQMSEFKSQLKTLTDQQQATVEAMSKTQDRHLAEFREQISVVTQQHQATVVALTASQEKQIDRILEKFSKCPAGDR